MSKALPTGAIVLGGGALSDLFFNHAHEHRRVLFAKARAEGDPPATEVREALAKDADSFLDCLAGVIMERDRPALRDWLVADFEARV